MWQRNAYTFNEGGELRLPKVWPNRDWQTTIVQTIGFTVFRPRLSEGTCPPSI